LDAAHDDQERLAGSQRAAQRGRGEYHQPRHEQPSAAKQVSRPSPEQQETAERQSVGGHHPLQVRLGNAQLAADGRQGDVHDRQVNGGHEVRHG
jgi:hypothetical protein